MPDTIAIVLVVCASLCGLAYAAVVVYFRGKYRGWDDANKLNDRYAVRRRRQEDEG